MRTLLHVAAAIAVSGMLASTAARAAEPIHYPGGPIQEGNYCWVSTQSDLGLGYWQACPKPTHLKIKKK